MCPLKNPRKAVVYLTKRIYILLVIIVAANLFASCSNTPEVRLTVWCSALDKELITKMVSDFMATKPGVDGVDIVICEDDEARSVFEASPASAADIICIPHDQLGSLVAKSLLLEITESKYTEAILANSYASVAAGQIQGRQYGFPSSFETHMLFYDRSLLSDDIIDTLENILANTFPADTIPFAMNFDNAYFSANWFFTYGCSLFGEDGEDPTFCDFDSDKGLAAMLYIVEMREHLGSINDEEALRLFGEHRLGAYISGPWAASDVTSVLKGNYGCAMLPSVEGKAMQSFAGFKLYCVNKNTANKSAAQALAAWLTNSANQKTRFLRRTLIPVANSLANDADVAASATAWAVINQGQNVIPMPSIPQMSNFWTPTGRLTHDCYLGNIDPRDLARNLRELVNVITGVSAYEE